MIDYSKTTLIDFLQTAFDKIINEYCENDYFCFCLNPVYGYFSLGSNKKLPKYYSYADLDFQDILVFSQAEWAEYYLNNDEYVVVLSQANEDGLNSNTEIKIETGLDRYHNKVGAMALLYQINRYISDNIKNNHLYEKIKDKRIDIEISDSDEYLTVWWPKI